MKNEEIQKQAKVIIDSFQKALDKAGIKEENVTVEREEDRRKEREGEIFDSEFRDLMFKNAKNKKGDFIQAEKGEWT